VNFSIPIRGTLPAGVLALALASCGAAATEAGSADERPPVQVTAEQARTMTLRPELELIGQLVPRPEAVAVVAARVGGSVSAVHVVAGDVVAAGDVLIDLDPRVLAGEVDRASAEAAQRRAALQLLERGPREQELAIARADRDRAAAAAQSAAEKLQSLEALEAHAEISPVRLAEARTARRTADAELAAAGSALELLEAGTRPEVLQQARATLAAAEADLALARARLGFTSLPAPLAGTVMRLEARPGMGVDPGTPLAEVADLARLLARVRLPAETVPRLDPEGACTVTPDAGSAALEGTIDRFGPAAEESTGGVWAFVGVVNPGELRPGMSGRVALPLRPVADCTAVPLAAVAERDGVAVLTVIRDGAAHEIEVRTGERAHGWVQILDGVAPGDLVATRGGYGLPEGQAVEVVSATDAR